MSSTNADMNTGRSSTNVDTAPLRYQDEKKSRHRPSTEYHKIRRANTLNYDADGDKDTYFSVPLPRLIDQTFHALLGRVSAGVSPGALLTAYADWLIHLSLAPGKQLQLTEKLARKILRLQKYILDCSTHHPYAEPCIEPLPQDRRFRSDDWQSWPYNVAYQAFLLNQQWWHNATTGVRGVNRRHEMIVSFVTRQFLDMFSPSNFLLTNPEILKRTVNERGANLARGAQNAIDDWRAQIEAQPTENRDGFQVGKNLAVTPGKVIYRNELIELIQYEPKTNKVHTEPILIIPAWIMKYYVLDLNPKNSLVRFLVEQGFTVFMISWKNPGPSYRNYGMDDYLNLGIFHALDAVSTITKAKQTHLVGYCLGGTLLSIAAAAMARDNDDRSASITLLAAQTDFTEPGELELFINESEIAFLEDMMWEKGYLDSHHMMGTFQFLRSNDLIWSRLVRDYLMGDRKPTIDLIAWNADTTRMPFRMHSEYLRQLFLNNDLAEGRYKVNGKPVALTDIRTPLFVVATQKDHIAPWRSVYKIHLLTDTDVTFVLTKGGHNGGIISQPGHPRRTYQLTSSQADGQYVDPQSWASQTPNDPGSWWNEWTTWLKDRSSGQVTPPAIGTLKQTYPVLCDAPGTYVLEQ